MNIIQNENVAFRCPNTLKEKLQRYAEENDLRMSAVVRTACVEWLKLMAPKIHHKTDDHPAFNKQSISWLVNASNK